MNKYLMSEEINKNMKFSHLSEDYCISQTNIESATKLAK